jgi:hypothetical protein
MNQNLGPNRLAMDCLVIANAPSLEMQLYREMLPMMKTSLQRVISPMTMSQVLSVHLGIAIMRGCQLVMMNDNKLLSYNIQMK